MLAEAVVGSKGVQAVDGVPLRLVFVQGLQHVLNPPELPLDVDMLLAGRLRLVGTDSGKGRLKALPESNALREGGGKRDTNVHVNQGCEPQIHSGANMENLDKVASQHRYSLKKFFQIINIQDPNKFGLKTEYGTSKATNTIQLITSYCTCKIKLQI